MHMPFQKKWILSPLKVCLFMILSPPMVMFFRILSPLMVRVWNLGGAPDSYFNPVPPPSPGIWIKGILLKMAREHAFFCVSNAAIFMEMVNVICCESANK